MRALQAYPLQAAASVGSFLGLVALALSISGLYGVLIYTLAQRTREIGIRMALGANAGAVVRLVMGQSARLAVIGAAVGVTVAFGAMKVLSAYVRMHNVAWLDGGAFVGGCSSSWRPPCSRRINRRGARRVSIRRRRFAPTCEVRRPGQSQSVGRLG